MKQMYVDGIKPNGFYYNSIKYTLSSPSYLKRNASITVPKTITPSAGSNQTSGYLHTITVNNSNQFRLYSYDDLNHPLTSVPSGYKFVLKNVTDTIINGLTLVYDGNELFHISGSYSTTYYENSKTSSYTCVVALVDANDNVYLTDSYSLMFSDSKASSSTSTSFTQSTLTYGTETQTFENILNITLPYEISTDEDLILYSREAILNTKFPEIKTYYAVCSNYNKSSSYTVNGIYLY